MKRTGKINADYPRRVLSLCHHGVSESIARKRFIEAKLKHLLDHHGLTVVAMGIEPRDIDFSKARNRDEHRARLLSEINRSLITFVSSEHVIPLRRVLRGSLDELLAEGKVVVIRYPTHQLGLKRGRAGRRGPAKGPAPEDVVRERAEYYQNKILSAIKKHKKIED